MTRASRGRGRPGIRGDSMGVKITMVSLGANRGTDDSDNMWDRLDVGRVLCSRALHR